jgi:ribosomal protein S18 acetylase RimI-like enzyme
MSRRSFPSDTDAVTIDIRRLEPGDIALALVAGELFDAPPDPEATQRFLGSPDHHLLLAVDDDQPVGFVTGVEMTHPDKGTEMFLYELGVVEAAWRRGVGARLVEALRDLATERGCYGMWVLTEDDNDAAIGTYRRAGGQEAPRPVMFGWPLGTPAAGASRGGTRSA